MNPFDLIFPKHCVGCGKIGKYFCNKCISSIKIIKSNESICPVCEKLAVDGATHPGCQTKYSLDGLISFFRYDGIVRQAIKSIKYRFVSDLVEEFIDLIPKASLSFLCHSREGGNPSLRSKWIPEQVGDDKGIIVPIPLHSSRFRWRGFNQAEELGKILAQKLNVSFEKNILKRVKKTIPQVEMKDKKKRLANMEGVFAIDELSIIPSERLRTSNSQLPASPAGRSIILFDDVFTTGATMRSAASVLKRSGVKKVWGISMAR